MARRITQQELHDESDAIIRALGQGESFIVTSDGVPVGELVPFQPRTFVPVERAKAAFAGLGPIDARTFRDDLDSVLDQDPTPRA